MKDKDRLKVAEEAAKLLYYNFFDDYKSAKEAACTILEINGLPSNFDVAIKLDKLTDEMEGELRRDLLVNLRKKALQIMSVLEFYKPRLIGSVWRGTARKGSDIDITVYSENVNTVVNLLRLKYGDVKAEFKSKTSEGITRRFSHVYFRISPGYDVEVVIRNPDEINERRRCEVFGDYVIGLTRDKLYQLLESDSFKKFLPERKIRSNKKRTV